METPTIRENMPKINGKLELKGFPQPRIKKIPTNSKGEGRTAH